MKRLLIFGDSILKGIYFSEELGRHCLYRERLAGLKSAGWQIKNNSVMGATVTTGESLLRRKLSEGLGTDENSGILPSETDGQPAVILEFGGNDCDYRWKEISENPRGDFLPGTPADRFSRQYAECVEYVRRAGAKVFLCNLVPLSADRYMDWISRDLNRDNILSWLGDVGRLARWQEFYSREAEKTARRTGCALIDLRSAFLSSPSYADLISADGIHPTVEGHRLIDGIIAEAVAG